MKNKVNIFIIGAPKCGTTALFSYLVNSTDIKPSISNIKEPYYFSDDLPKIRKLAGFNSTLKEYEENFDLDEVNNIDASAWYLYSKTAVKNIYNYNPDAKIIVMLRNPVDMVYSLYYQHRRKLENIKSFEHAWNKSKKRKESLFVRNIDLSLFDYQTIGMYSHQLERLFSIFNKDQIKIILFDDFIKDPRKEYNKVSEFLSLVPKKNIIFDKINENQVERRLLINFMNMFPKEIISIFKKFKIIIFGNRKIHFLIKKEPRADLSENFQKELKEFYKNDVVKVERLLNLNLRNWK
jgi:hypothetical protein